MTPEPVSGAPLSSCGTFRLGGPCRRLYDCATPDDVAEAARDLRAAGDPFVLIGGGSNLLFSDHGYRGDVIRFATAADPRPTDGGLRVAAGCDLDDLVAATVESGLDGLVACSGIPGTVGGAVVGNAGAWGKQIGDVLAAAELLGPGGTRRWARAEELGFAYRDSRLKRSGDIVLTVEFRLPPGDRSILRARRDEILALRRDKHPDPATEPCIGSVFRNIEPSSAAGRRRAAGWFLEQAGAKALRVGGARIYEKHANIIVAGPGCTAQDVHDLSLRMRAAVRERFGMELRREVRFLGKFTGPEEGPDSVFF